MGPIQTKSEDCASSAGSMLSDEDVCIETTVTQVWELSKVLNGFEAEI